jgi:amphi-Trp domain-containing protein
MRWITESTKKEDDVMPNHKDKLELKELCTKDRYVRLLRQLADCLEKDQEMTVTILGQENTIPSGVGDQARLEVEYEVKEGLYEFELEMKWPTSRLQEAAL